MKELNNLKNEEIIQKAKENILLKKKSVRATFNKMNPQDQLILKLEKKRIKYNRKMTNDLKEVKKIIFDLKEGYETMLISNAIDSPNILQAIHEMYKIKNVYISTWAITNVAFLRLMDMTNSGITFHIVLDIIHSYKWIHTSGAKDIINQNAHFYFTENHSKFQLYELEDGSCINLIGSFNFTNNPRYENIRINRCKEDFNFYKSFVEMVANKKNETQKSLF